MTFLKNNKKGISEVITTLILIALVIVVIAIVWKAIDSMLHKSIDQTEACYGNYGKIELNSRYVCYNSSSKEIKFAIKIGDVDVDRVIVSIASEEETKTFSITNELSAINNLKYSTGDTLVKLPSKNGGATYIASGFQSKPDSIEVAPVINEKQCEVSDRVFEIEDCNVLFEGD